MHFISLKCKENNKSDDIKTVKTERRNGLANNNITNERIAFYK